MDKFDDDNMRKAIKAAEETKKSLAVLKLMVEKHWSIMDDKFKKMGLSTSLRNQPANEHLERMELLLQSLKNLSARLRNNQNGLNSSEI